MLYFNNKKSSGSSLSASFFNTDWDTGYSPYRGEDVPVKLWLGHTPGVGMLELKFRGSI